MRAPAWLVPATVAALLYGGLVVGLDQLRWRPMNRELTALRERADRSSRELREARAVAERPQAFETVERRLDRELARLRATLPDRLAPGSLTARVRSAAAERGLTLAEAGDEVLVARDLYAEVQVTVTFGASTEQAEAFAAALEAASPMTRLTRFRWSLEADGQPLWVARVTGYQASPPDREAVQLPASRRTISPAGSMAWTPATLLPACQ